MPVYNPNTGQVVYEPGERKPGEINDTDFDKQLGYYKNLYAFTNEQQQASATQNREQAFNYRVKEGATQGQVDEQSFRRLSANLGNQRTMQESSLGNQRFLQQKGAELTDWQRDQDYNRASRAIGDMRNTRMTR